MLARAFMATEQAHSAIALSTTAEQRFQEAHSTRLMLEARVLKAQATFTADPEQRAEATATLVELLPQLSEVRRLNVSAWLKKSARQRTPDSARRSD